jgi:hypothetical protein
MLKLDLTDEPLELAEGSSPAMPSSTAVMAAMITQSGEARALCAHVASSIVSGAGSTCGSRAAIAAAFDDLSALPEDAVGELLRGRTC